MNLFSFILFPGPGISPGVLRSQTKNQWVGYTFCTTRDKGWREAVNIVFEASIRLPPTPLLGAGGAQE